MSRLAPAIIVVALLAASGAGAQNAAGSGSSGVKAGGPWPAPVGHRQPTAAEVGAGGANNQQNGADAEDKALDRKIKSICKGC